MQKYFIDVREPEEFAAGHVQGARNIPPAQLMQGSRGVLADIPKDAELVVYCRTGSRSNAAIQILEQMGYTNLTNGINRDHVESHFRL